MHLILLIVLFLSCTSCAHYQVNQPLRSMAQNNAYTFTNFDRNDDSDKTFVILTFSGGGTRAAAFSYGVLEEMKDTPLPGTDKTVLDEVDVISTVSGGSFTGAYYGLFGNRIFEDFKSRFLYRDIQKEIALKLLNPVTLFRLASPYFNRIDLAGEIYDSTIFDSSTFKELTDKGRRPFIIINSTNLYQGARFEFTGDQFDYIGSNILAYPIARAVAASSAFPFLLSPISLVNYPDPADYQLSLKDQMAMKDYWNNRSRYTTALNKVMYSDKEKHPYIHLMDGGLADNTGLRAIEDLFVRGGLREKINNGKIQRLIVIVVNAKNEPPQTFDRNEGAPGLSTVAVKTCTLSMDNYSFETVEAMKGLFSARISAQMEKEACQKLLDEHCQDGYKGPEFAGGNMKLYVVDLSFDNLTDDKEKSFLKHLPTTFHLQKDEVDRLIMAGRRLLREDPVFGEFIREYN